MFTFNLQRRSKSPFDLAKFVPLDPEGGGFDSSDSQMIDKLPQLTRFGEVEVVGEEGRLDLISHRIYGHTAYWWVLLIYNNISSFEDVVPGTFLGFPSLDDLEQFFLELRGS